MDDFAVHSYAGISVKAIKDGATGICVAKGGQGKVALPRGSAALDPDS